MTEPAPSAATAAAAGFTHRQILTILTGLMLGMFLAALDQTIVCTAIRTIADDLHGLSLQAWVTTAYLITSTIATPLYGKLVRHLRAQAVLSSPRSRSSSSARCCARSRTSMYELAAFRAIQGIGAGGLLSLALAIIGDIVPPRERARYQGYFMAVFGTSSVLGPVIGGFFAGAGRDPRHHRLALGLPHQRADRHRRADRGRPRAAPPATTPRAPHRLVGARSRWWSAWCRC